MMGGKTPLRGPESRSSSSHTCHLPFVTTSFLCSMQRSPCSPQGSTCVEARWASPLPVLTFALTSERERKGFLSPAILKTVVGDAAEPGFLRLPQQHLVSAQVAVERGLFSLRSRMRGSELGTILPVTLCASSLPTRRLLALPPSPPPTPVSVLLPPLVTLPTTEPLG